MTKPGRIRVTNRIFTIGNILSVSRILILPWLIWEFEQNEHQPNTVMFAIVVYIILSDFLDGFFSRKFNQVSETGKWLDPLADKVCAAILFAYVWWIGLIPAWFFFIVVARDVIILAGSLFVRYKRGKLAMSVMAGKVAVNVLAAYWLAVVFTPDLTELIVALKFAALTMLLYSAWIYAIRGYEILNGADFQ